MENWILFVTSVLLTYSGFTIALYRILTKSMIDKIFSVAYEKGVKIEAEENRRYYSTKIEKWKSGTLFNSPLSLVVGFVIFIGGAFISMIDNPWWSIVLSLAIGYILYLRISYAIGWRVQVVSSLIFLAGLILLIVQFIIGFD